MDPFSLAVLGGINLGLGGLKSAQAAKQRKQEMMTRAAELEASPWTGRSPATQVTTPTTNPWAELAGGALNTLSQAAALKQAGLLNSDSENLNANADLIAPKAAQAQQFFNTEYQPLSRNMWGQMSSPTLYSMK